MADYLDLDTIHEPSIDAPVPAAWGHAIGSNLDWMQRPYTFIAKRSGTDPVPDNSLTELPLDLIVWHSGEFYPSTDAAPTTLTVPVGGWYLATAELEYEYSTYTATTTSFTALLDTDDNDQAHYLLRSSGNISIGTQTIGGLVRLDAGANIAFAGFQDSGADATVTGSVTLSFLGRLA